MYFLSIYTNINNAVFQNLFNLNNEDWNIVGNKNVSTTFMPFNLNGLMSNYITGKDDLINVDYKNKDDRNLWFFSKKLSLYLSNSSILSFTMSSFSGDFSKLNNPNSSVATFIKLCNNVTNDTIIFPIKNLINEYDGKIKMFVIPFVSSLWLNGVNNMPVSFDDFKLILQNITQIDILGDWTRGTEIIGLDNVKIY
jgi:hypothetical protein